MTDRARALTKHALDLVWRLWGQLGVSTWTESHQGWAMELEPLVVFTAFLADHDRRLLRETVDWCVAHDAYLSTAQLRHVVRAGPASFEEHLGRYGATVSLHTTRTWPGSEGQTSFDVSPSGKSRLRDLDGPARIQLRLRSLFGISARAEIVRVLLIDPYRQWATAEIARRVAYTRRQINNDLEALTLGGLVRRSELSGSFTYNPVHPEPLIALVGEQPTLAPPWSPLFHVLAGLLEAARDLRSREPSMPAMELARRLRSLTEPLELLGLEPPRTLAEETYAPELLDWAESLFEVLARGAGSEVPRTWRTAVSNRG